MPDSEVITAEDLVRIPNEEVGEERVEEVVEEVEKVVEEVDETEKIIDQREEEEVGSEEKEEVEGEDKVADEVEKVVEEVVEKTPEFKYEELSEDFTITSKADLDVLLKELKQSRERDPYEGIDPVAASLDKALKGGLDAQQYLTAMSLDPESLSDTEALKQKYFLDNADVFKDDADFAQMKFDRYLEGLRPEPKPEEFESEQEEAEWERNNKFAEKSYQHEVTKAKKALSTWKEDNTKIEAKQEASAEQIQAVTDKYHAQVDGVVKEVSGIEMPVGEDSFKYSLPEARIKEVGDLMKDPKEALRYLGFDLDTGDVDTTRLYGILAMDKSIHEIGAKVGEWYLEKKNADTIDSKEKGVRKTNKPGTGSHKIQTEAEEAAEGLNTARRRGRE